MTPRFEAEALALLRSIAARQAALVEEVAAIRAAVDFDRGALAALLPALDASVGCTFDWTARELDRPCRRSGARCYAHPSKRSVGALDARAADARQISCGASKALRVGGLRIERVGVGRDGAIRILRRE